MNLSESDQNGNNNGSSTVALQSKGLQSEGQDNAPKLHLPTHNAQ